MVGRKAELPSSIRAALRGSTGRSFVSAIVILLLVVSPAFAQLPAARLTAVFPPGGRAGASFDVTVTGVDLDGATELRFSQPGITAKPAGESESTTERKFTVVIGPDVPVGECEARFTGTYGISNSRAFAVGDRPEIVRTQTDKPGTIAPLTVGSVVNARCAAGVIDSYPVELKQGQRVLFECAARGIDSRMSPVMVLLDRASREIDRSRHGGLLDFTAPADGTYTLQVHDLLYRGGPEYFYRLSAGIGPRLDAIFPPAGQPGSKAKYTLYGRNLPGGSTSGLRAADGKPLDQLEVEIELPADASAPQRLDAATLAGTSGSSADTVAYRLPSDKGASNPVLIGLARSPLLIEQEPNDKPEQAQKLSPPCEIAGRFYPRGDQDYFTFEAAKGDVYWIEVFSERMGLPTNPFVLVQKVTKNDKGVEQASDVQEMAGTEANAGGPAFRTSTRDGAYRLEAKDGGTYRLLVRDLFNTARDNAALTYRLSVRKEQPDFRILAVPVAGPNNEVILSAPFLRKGGALPVRLIIVRQDGFNGEVRVEAEGLPGDLTCGTTTIPAGESVGSLVVSAGNDASGWCG
ncbi:MAG: peptidase domain protein, partial [Phycisphaerales bacterium]|nr:peptidase domain protein [Phycisphaerales bacterium]